MITVVDESIVYRNAFPQLRAENAWHPSLVRLGASRWLASFDLGEAVEAHGYGTVLSWSDDDGATWSEPRRVLTSEQHGGSYTLRLSRLSDGRLMLAGALHAPRPYNQGMLNPDTFGYTPMTLTTMVSADDGETWSEPTPLRHELPGTEFETCHHVVELDDGRLALPTNTWMTWAGDAPYGMKAVLLVSSDGGETWPDTIVVADDWDRRVTHFEQSLVQLHDSRLLSVTWPLNVDDFTTEPTPYAISSDGRQFDVRALTGLSAQTAKLCVLGDGSVLVAFRGESETGLWLAHARLDGERWITEQLTRAWSGAESAGGGTAADELSDLRFAYPSMVLRPDGLVDLVFWCREGDINVIKKLRVDVTPADSREADE